MDQLTTQMWTATGRQRGTSWNVRVPGTNSWFKIDWLTEHNMWMGAGTGVLARSVDGTSWVTTSRDSFVSWRSFAVSSTSRIVAVASGGQIKYSDNGSIWTFSGSSLQLYDVIWDGSRFVGAGGSTNALIGYSTDGVSWVTVVPAGSPSLRRGIAWNGSLYVAVGNGGTIITSPDLATWTSQTSGTANQLNAITWNSILSLWVAVGNSGTVLTSADGVTWISRTSSTVYNLNDIKYNGARYVAVGSSGTVITSTDGITWSTVSPSIVNAGTKTLEAVGWSGSYFMIGAATSTLVLLSNDLTSGSRLHHGESYKYGIAYSPSLNLWVAAGGLSGQGIGNITTTSTDTIIWTERTAGGNPTTLWNVKWSQDRSQFIVIGGAGTIRTSSDGINWTAQVSNTTVSLYGLACLDIRWCIVGSIEAGSAIILTTDDGITWTKRTSNSASTLNAVAASDVPTAEGVQFVAVGDGGTIVTSDSSRTTWTPRTSGTTSPLYNIVWTGSQFIATISTGNVLTSPDGVTWTSRSTGGSDSWRAMFHDQASNTTYVGSIGGVIKASTDGITWVQRATNLTATELHGATTNGPTIIFVGSNGIVLTSP